MAFIKLLSGKALPRGIHYGNITLMEYENSVSIPPGCIARKFCYIIKRVDLQRIFDNAGLILPAIDPHNTKSFWNRRRPNKDNEYGVEICEDDNGDPIKCKNPVYLVYDKHWLHGGAEAQHKIYSGEITETQADNLDKELRKYDIP